MAQAAAFLIESALGGQVLELCLKECVVLGSVVWELDGLWFIAG